MTQPKAFTSPSFALCRRKPAPRGALIAYTGVLLAWATSLLLGGCAAELEDPAQYTTRVRPGVGASGVLPPQGNDTPNVQPTVSPQQTTGVDPDQTDEETTSSPTTSVSPTSSVAPSPSVSPSSGLSAECADVPTRILQGKCAGSACHGTPDTPAAGFSDIASTTDPMHLLDVPAKFTCSSKMLIDSQNPADSAILSAVEADGHCSGGQMPSGGPYLTEDEVSCLTEWVNAVASGAI